MKSPRHTEASDDNALPGDGSTIGDDLVQAALRVAEALGKDVADVPVIAIAREAGISRSTLIRRLGGSRTALDDAVCAAGVDPGGQAPVRIRALDAAATLVSTTGLSSATLEAVAALAQCSVNSLHLIFSGRDELIRAVFERHSPLLDIEDFFTTDHGDLATTVRQFYGLMARSLSREPRVAPALLAEAFARPDSPAVQNLVQHNAPRLLASIGAWLDAEVQANTIRDIPSPLLTQQLMSPIVIHLLVRPAMPHIPGVDLPDIDTTCDTFADAFLRAVATTPPP
jgi:AcrR family transcriptional regulator